MSTLDERELVADGVGVIVYSCGCWVEFEGRIIPDYICPECSQGWYKKIIQ